jgi:hypothetical protein
MSDAIALSRLKSQPHRCAALFLRVQLRYLQHKNRTVEAEELVKVRDGKLFPSKKEAPVATVVFGGFVGSIQGTKRREV